MSDEILAQPAPDVDEAALGLQLAEGIIAATVPSPAEKAGRAIAGYVAELERRIGLARAYAPEQDLAVEFMAAHAHLDPEPSEWNSRLRVHLSLDPSSVNALMINFDAKTLAEVTEPLRWLSQRLGAYTIDDFPELGRRAYIFTSEGRSLRFQVFFNSNSSVCRFVEVGKEEKPIFKLMCGEEAVQ